MNTGKTLFAQVMDFLPWTTFQRIVIRHGGDRRIRTLTCADQYRAMAFAQLTYRESLRDIETCLEAQSAKLYHMGFRQSVRRSTLADANETRDWRIYADFAWNLIRQARNHIADVVDVRNVADGHRGIGQQHRRQDGQGLVLVAGWRNLPADGPATFHDQFLQRSVSPSSSGCGHQGHLPARGTVRRVFLAPP